MPPFAGAAEWLNSEPLGPAELRGHVVLVNFWTLTCINWLRQEPYVRAWSQAYRDDGLVVIGVHTPEFSFEHEIDRVRQAIKEREIDYPVAVDNDYDDLERVRQPLLAGALLHRQGRHHPRPALRRRTLRAIRARHPAAARRRARARLRRRGRRRSASRLGPPADARDLSRLRAQRALLVSRTAPRSTNPAPTSSPSGCASTTGRLAGEWTIGRENVVLDHAGGSIAYRFHARDAHLVLSPGARRADPLPRAPRRRGPGPVTRRRRRRGRKRRAPGRPPVPARAPARRGPRANASDHVPRARRRGVRVHLRVARTMSTPRECANLWRASSGQSSHGQPPLSRALQMGSPVDAGAHVRVRRRGVGVGQAAAPGASRRDVRGMPADSGGPSRDAECAAPAAGALWGHRAEHDCGGRAAPATRTTRSGLNRSPCPSGQTAHEHTYLIPRIRPTVLASRRPSTSGVSSSPRVSTTYFVARGQSRRSRDATSMRSAPARTGAPGAEPSCSHRRRSSTRERAGRVSPSLRTEPTWSYLRTEAGACGGSR